MGRKRTGSLRQVGPNQFEVRIAGEQLGTYSDKATAQRMRRAALAVRACEGPLTFARWSEAWWEQRELEAMQRKRLRSFEKDRSRWNTHVTSAPFFDLPLKRQSVVSFQQWVRALAKTEALHPITFGRGANKRVEHRKTGRMLSRKVISEALNLVQLCLDAATREGKMPGLIIDGKTVAGNPARMVLLPPERVSERDGQLIVHLLTEEIAAVFALDLPLFVRAVFAIAIYAGLRMEEIWGLRWMDTDLDGPKPQLMVRRAFAGPVKSKNSRRDVPLLAYALFALKAWRASQPRAIGATLVFPNEDGKCFAPGYDAGWRNHYQTHRDGTPYETPGWRQRAGIRKEVSFKELRHTCGCHLVQGTWTPEPLSLLDVKTWLGHSSIAVTERHYAGLTSDNLHSKVLGRGYVGNKWGRPDDHTL